MGSLKDEKGRLWTDMAQDMINNVVHEVNKHFKREYGRNVTEEELRKMFEASIRRQPTMEEETS